MIKDLIYDNFCIPAILEKWPDAKITDASDYIHEGRFELEIDIEEDEFYPFAIREGFALSCFVFNMWTMDNNKENKEKVWRWLKELDKIVDYAQQQKEE